MAEDPETPEEEAHSAPAEPAKGPRKGRAVDRPVSLFPLSFEEAVDGLLQVKPEPGKKGGAESKARP
jgi:hypothetical protein